MHLLNFIHAPHRASLYNKRKGGAMMGFFSGSKDIRIVEQRVLSSVRDHNQTKQQETKAMAETVKELLANASGEVIILCIGSDRSVGDSLGPLVGTMLVEAGVTHTVYGTLEEPVHAFNLETTMKKINRQFEKPVVLSIDAGLGNKEDVGTVFLKKGPLIPGKALQKVLPPVGDYHITGVVNYLDPLPAAQFLNDTRLYTVRKLAETIVNVIK